MQKIVTVEIKGIAPLLMHNVALADRFTTIGREMKEITNKRKKTEADLDRMAVLEFMGGLYVGKDGAPILPAHVIDALIVEGAKLSKEGPRAKAGVISEDAALEYDGPKSARELWERREEFSLRAFVRVNAGRVLRIRPMFSQWAATLTIVADASILDPKNVPEWVEAAGRQKGLGDWRPRYGRFAVTSSAITDVPMKKAA